MWHDHLQCNRIKQNRNILYCPAVWKFKFTNSKWKNAYSNYDKNYNNRKITGKEKNIRKKCYTVIKNSILLNSVTEYGCLEMHKMCLCINTWMLFWVTLWLPGWVIEYWLLQEGFQIVGCFFHLWLWNWITDVPRSWKGLWNYSLMDVKYFGSLMFLIYI